MKDVLRLASKTILNMNLTPPNSAVPVMSSHPSKFTLCMPSGSTILSTAPAKGEVRREGKDQMRNEETGEKSV